MSEQAMRQPLSHAGRHQGAAQEDSLTYIDEASAIDEEIWGKLASWKTEETQAITRIVDGGAFAWTYGLVPFAGWLSVRESYRHALICWDSYTSVRQEGFAGYKGRRAERRKADPQRHERREQVRRFSQLIQADPNIAGCYLEGYEADDLVAIHYLHAIEEEAPVRVYGIDKDLLQLPGIVECLYNFDGSSRDLVLTDYPKRAPLYWPETRDHKDLLLYQLLFGDRSDSITRLLSKGDKATARKIHGSPNPFIAAYECWQEKIFESLMLLLMPSPTLAVRWSQYERYPESLLVDIETGVYWTASNFPHDCQSGNTDGGTCDLI